VPVIAQELLWRQAAEQGGFFHEEIVIAQSFCKTLCL
jgi:hypothetical protein